MEVVFYGGDLQDKFVKIKSARLYSSYLLKRKKYIFCGGKIFSSGAEYWPKRQIYP